MVLKRILVIDDEKNILAAVRGGLEDEGYLVETAGDGVEGLDQMRRFAPDVVLLDIWMPGEDGIKILEKIKKWDPLAEVIMMSGHGTVETAVRALKLGAFDFLEKPLQLEKLLILIQHAFEMKQLKTENTFLKKELEGESLTVKSPSMQKMMDLVKSAAPSNGWVLIQGETGVGKELVARALHQWSERGKGRFIAVNCAVVEKSSLEAVFFGCEKEPSVERKIGLLEQADSGTLLLDEVDELDPGIQRVLLDALENGVFRRKGGKADIEVDVRVIAATNRNLKQLVMERKFLEEFFFKLSVIPISVPPLRNRMECIPPLVETFLRRYSKGRMKRITSRSLKLLQTYPWPGNVRELKNWVERACMLATDEVIDSKPPGSHKGAIDIFNFDELSLASARQDFEKQFLERLLSEKKGDVSETASVLGIGKAQLNRKLKNHSLESSKRS